MQKSYFHYHYPLNIQIFKDAMVSLSQIKETHT